ncbi:MAG: hypothetical protein OEO79_14735 [Gemmatimonadota bacterium]|nr:hypothetical protein [Gemmatimonadota bacterium]
MKSAGFGRALVELVVIFVGILTALLADSWWEDRQARHREAEYLVSLAEDFAENETRLTSAISIADTSSAAAAALLAVGPGGTELTTDSLRTLFSRLRRLPTFEPVTKTYDNILGAGDILTLRDGPLRAELADFQSRLTLMNVVQETQERQLVGIQLPYFITHLDFVGTLNLRSDRLEAPEVIPSHFTEARTVIGTREFRNWVAVRLEWSDDLRNQHVRVLARVKAVQGLVRPTS